MNTPHGKVSRKDEALIGRTALAYDVPCLMTLSAAWASIQAIRFLQNKPLGVVALQEVFNEADNRKKEERSKSKEL